jgi:hypothetical protein
MMIPEGHKSNVISSGITFMRSITEAYGSEDGLKLWDAIANTLDPDVKGAIFFALITGDYQGEIIARGFSSPMQNYVECIKAIRSYTGWGLKEAKEAADLIRDGVKQTLTVSTDKRNEAIMAFRRLGFLV